MNIAEVLSKLEDRRPGLLASLGPVPAREPGEGTLTLRGWPVIRGSVTVEPFTFGDAAESAVLRATTRPYGLSLGDRACLALAKRLDLDALTADTNWQQVSGSIGVRVRAHPLVADAVRSSKALLMPAPTSHCDLTLQGRGADES